MIRTFCGGRAAEEITFHSITTGASNDIERATRLARQMITMYGMSDEFGLVALETVESQYLDGRSVLNCSDETSAKVDEAVRRVMKECYEQAKAMLLENIEILNKAAEFLIEKETITGKQFMEIFRAVKEPAASETEANEGTETAEKTDSVSETEEAVRSTFL
jgi:cell division protease FtsH